MTVTLCNDTDQMQDWCYKNGICKYTLHELTMIYYLGYEVDFPAEIELEVEIEEESYTHHPYGSTTATQVHDAEIIQVKYNNKPVTMPEWLIDKIWSKI